MTNDSDLVTCPRAPGILRLSPGRCVQLWRDTQETVRRRSYLKAQHKTNMMLRPMDVYRAECATCPVGRERSEHYEASGRKQVPEPKAETFTFQRFALAEGWTCEREMFLDLVKAHGFPKRIAAVLGVTIASVSQRLNWWGCGRWMAGGMGRDGKKGVRHDTERGIQEADGPEGSGGHSHG